MPYELFLAIRYLRSRRKRRLARLTALFAVLGITVGVGALIVALALANGFRDEMRDKILRGTAHISVMRADGQPMKDYFAVAERIKTLEGVVEASATTYEGAVIVGPRGSAYAVLRGIDDKSEGARADVRRWLVAGSMSPVFERKEGELPSVILGAELASRTGLVVSDVADVVPASVSVASNAAVRRLVRVAGIFRAGLFEYDSTWIYLSLDAASSLAGSRGSAAVISVQVKDIYDVRRVAQIARANLGSSYTTIDWQEANRPLFTALALERRMGLFVITLIIFIAALNITTALIMVVVDRRRDIAILSAMGGSGRSIMGIFLIEGAVIGVVGALLGSVLGGIMCLVGNRYELVSLPADVYSIGNVPFHLSLRDMLLAAVVAFLLSLMATIYPARAAAQVRPVAMLRETQ